MAAKDKIYGTQQDRIALISWIEQHRKYMPRKMKKRILRYIYPYFPDELWGDPNCIIVANFPDKIYRYLFKNNAPIPPDKE